MSKRKRKQAKALNTDAADELTKLARVEPERGSAYITLSCDDMERWGDIEVELANLRNAAQAVQCVGDVAGGPLFSEDGTDLTAALRFLCVGIEARLDCLKELLGLGERER